LEKINQKDNDFNSNSDKTGSNNQLTVNPSTVNKPPKPPKPPKPEDKPFKEFVNHHLIPSLKKELEKRQILISDLILLDQQRPVVGGACKCLYGDIDNGRRFWLCFSEEKITSIKSISLSERGSEPSLIESFLIDEKKTTLSLLISRLLQRLNGQKWLEPN
tara:strand:- start:11166 stop:11648 length:483 start_codon:yes stop_codon:yes gene_type:complete